MRWKESVNSLLGVLDALAVSDGRGASLDADQAFALLAAWVRDCARDKRRVYFAGNGASASMASHFATDLAKMAKVPTEVFTDPALVTATGNDMGYSEVFAYPLAQRMRSGEILVAISSSGSSPNVVRAAETARKLDGLIITFSAMSPGNKLRTLGDLNFYIPATTYGLAESGHAALLHHLVDLFDPRCGALERP
ncbi:MAG TPA: SIS domain-containing protein [Desulfovibrio sp.]|uniref:SIS domain-containing protein n=1 Tax=Desulfovibrio sp. TaxID=885 RepID=UPI002B5D9D09|nr:SIS domain-containing protein [Desulfovibrio sp.]HMM39171.1 SIS domain-containing protein [Desulfovibrio sp.]